LTFPIEKALASAIGNTYAYKARAGGKVLSVDESTQLMKLQYDDGEIAYVDMSPRSVKNSGGGFYITARDMNTICRSEVFAFSKFTG
jgi:hypothetical protein